MFPAVAGVVDPQLPAGFDPLANRRQRTRIRLGHELQLGTRQRDDVEARVVDPSLRECGRGQRQGFELLGVRRREPTLATARADDQHRQSAASAPVPTPEPGAVTGLFLSRDKVPILHAVDPHVPPVNLHVN